MPGPLHFEARAFVNWQRGSAPFAAGLVAIKERMGKLILLIALLPGMAAADELPKNAQPKKKAPPRSPPIHARSTAPALSRSRAPPPASGSAAPFGSRRARRGGLVSARRLCHRPEGRGSHSRSARPVAVRPMGEKSTCWATDLTVRLRALSPSGPSLDNRLWCSVPLRAPMALYWSESPSSAKTRVAAHPRKLPAFQPRLKATSTMVPRRSPP